MRRQYSSPSNGKEISDLLGIDKNGFINHINKYLLDGMTLENFGKIWSLDHIVPVDLFDILNVDEKRLCYNYLNIMPMFVNDNRLKGASVHFSLDKLKSLQSNEPLYTNVCIIETLIQKCNEEITRTYQKYLLPL
jgi:hypothetical protein